MGKQREIKKLAVDVLQTFPNLSYLFIFVLFWGGGGGGLESVCAYVAACMCICVCMHVWCVCVHVWCGVLCVRVCIGMPISMTLYQNII